MYVVYERGPEVRPKLYRSAYDAHEEIERRIMCYRERYGARFAAWYASDVLRCENPLRFALDQWPIVLMVALAMIIGGGLAL